ncbi:hypothetical protein ACVMII_007737 [Bradyrhizobium diazoefficiens]
MPLVIVALAGQGAAIGQLQITLRSLQSLDRGLLVHAQHNGLRRRRDIEADNIGGFGRKVRVVALAPGLASHQVNLVAAQEPPDILDIDIAQRLGQQGAGPARKPLRWRLIQQLQNPLVGRLRIDRLLARPRLVLQPFKAMVGIAMPPKADNPRLDPNFLGYYGVYGPPSMFPIPVLRFMKTYGITHEQLAAVAVVQREWAAKNPRAMMKDPITVADVLNSRMIAYPFRLLQCCLVTDGGGALILTSADRARDFPRKPVYIMGTGESVETPMVSQMETFNSSRAFKTAGPLAFKEAGIAHKDVDHLMIYDAFAHLPLFGLGDLGFMPHEETGRFIADGNTRPGAKLPLNTNGGGLSYMHSGMYGMYALQESVRQMRGIAPAQVPNAKISVCHGVGGMFAASGTIVFTNER